MISGHFEVLPITCKSMVVGQKNARAREIKIFTKNGKITSHIQITIFEGADSRGTDHFDVGGLDGEIEPFLFSKIAVSIYRNWRDENF